jgi:hypothetical protein
MIFKTKKPKGFRVQEIQQNSPAQKNCEKQFSVLRNAFISDIVENSFEFSKLSNS